MPCYAKIILFSLRAKRTIVLMTRLYAHQCVCTSSIKAEKSIRNEEKDDENNK
jgi:hypothetical protein